uniref:Protein Shroom2-like n=1 Tax=Paramormyrops kingsleyae TaxID=1676925 RepID=A0A3B3QTG9_9TELE|nr:protein Shroom2-like [Paramormyrops kingsleyae]XP_023647311.1 protein Shroom2-like [Paramormyrops kingsleyae]
MDSCKFSPEDVSRPLSCPVGRLGPAKSTSSIDQFVSHRGNGDSAYSSFSGGSSAPEYGPLHLADELGYEGFLASDFKSAVDDPCSVPSSPSRSVVHWYRTAENAPEPRVPHTLAWKNCSWEPPPAPPARLDSFIAVRHLENSGGSWSPRDQSARPRTELVRNLRTSQANPRNPVEYQSFTEGLQCGNHRYKAQNLNSLVQHRESNKVKPPEITGENTHLACLDWRSQLNMDDPDYVQQQCQGDQSLSSNRRDEEDLHTSPYGSPCSSYLSRVVQQKMEHKEKHHGTFRHHNSCQLIFYSGPEKGVPAFKPDKKERAFSLQGLDHADRSAGTEMTQPVANLALDEIDKATMPLLFHLAGESRGTLVRKSKGEIETNVILKELRLESSPKGQLGTKASDSSSDYGSSSGGTRQLEVAVQVGGGSGASALSSPNGSPRMTSCDGVRDTQPVVLMETTSKRTDLHTTPVPFKVTPVPGHTTSIQFASKVSSENPESLESGIWGKQNFAQLQVARAGLLKMLSPEQRNLCYSDPDSLNHMGDEPAYRGCRSVDDQLVEPVSKDKLSGQGLVAARRKVFETKGRALSAFCFSKSALKHIQREALQAYMECKAGRQGTGAQPPDRRHSMAGKVAEFGQRSLCRNAELGKEEGRPLSAGRLLDPPAGCVTCADLGSLSYCEQGHFNEKVIPATERSSSTDNLCRLRSTPTPYALQTTIRSNESLPLNNLTLSSQKSVEGKSSVSKYPVDRVDPADRAEPVDRVDLVDRADLGQVGRAVCMADSSRVPREEAATRRLGRFWASASRSESVEQLRGRRMAQAHEQRSSPSFFEGQERRQVLEHRRPLFKQESAPQLRVGELGSRDQVHSKAWAIPEPSTTGGTTHFPSSPSLSPAGSPSSLPVSGLDFRKRWIQSLSRGRSSSRVKTSPVQPSLLELSVDDPEEIFGSFPEVFLNQGVMTDSDLWLRSRDGERPPTGGEGGSQRTRDTQCQVQETDTSTREELLRKEEEDEEGVSVDEPESPSVATSETIVKWQWEDMVQQVAAEDQTLAHVLLPAASGITAVALIEQLLSGDTLLMEEHYRWKHAQEASGPDTEDGFAADVVCSLNAAHPTTEAQAQETGQTQGGAGSEVTKKKRLLMSCIERHLEALAERQAALRQELLAHGERANAMASLVQEHCLPPEYERYTQFLDDLERVVSLLLCLSARLARVQNALSVSDQHMDPEEKESLQNRHRLLCRQRDDAKGLRENLERRQGVVAAILAKYLSGQQQEEYKQMVQTKASLLIQQKDLDERQRLREEQLQALLGSLPP